MAAANGSVSPTATPHTPHVQNQAGDNLPPDPSLEGQPIAALLAEGLQLPRQPFVAVNANLKQNIPLSETLFFGIVSDF